MRPISRLLVANRGEIAARVIRAARELGIHTIAVYSAADARSAHRHLADEAVALNCDEGAVHAYLNVAGIVAASEMVDADAVHPGYGFLSESPDLAEALAERGIQFVGPGPGALRTLGSKVLAKELAAASGLPVLAASPPLSDDEEAWAAQAERIGYPLLCKASWGGGGRGMRLVTQSGELLALVREARAEALAAFGNDEVYLERFVERAQHVEVQIAADMHGSAVHLYDRDCSVQRKNQKVVEVAPSAIPDGHRAAMCEQAVRLVRDAGYLGVGTVEFLYDLQRGEWSFIEVNPRIQVEHPVTEAITGIDLVRAQLLLAQGGRIGDVERSGVPDQEQIAHSGYAIELRLTTEDPQRDFAATSGLIESIHLPDGPGIRIDGTPVHVGDHITTDFDTLFKKIVVWGPTWEVAVTRTQRAIEECVVLGVATNLAYLRWILASEDFRTRSATTSTYGRFTPPPDTSDPGEQLLGYLAEVHATGHPDLAGRSAETIERARRASTLRPPAPRVDPPIPGTKQLLATLGPVRFAAWMRGQTRVLVTDTTLRDAHQSLLATRLRTRDIADVVPAMAANLPELFSFECWGGATFDVALRFLQEDPWERLDAIRAAVPNVLLQMLIRGGSAVGYDLYPDEVVDRFIHAAQAAGIDVFRVFDSLNNVETMRSAIDAVLDSGALCEGAICYTADLFDPSRPRYDLRYYLDLAQELERAGCHVVAIKDMAGVCRPPAVRELVTALRETIGLPVHFHTHDTSGFSSASVYAAIDAGVDAVDVAIDSMSGLTSQPPMGSLVRALERQPRDTGLDPECVADLAAWWESTRQRYAPFESEMRSGTSDVYRHEIPGGQYTNLREQARRLGFGDARWPEVTRAYASANRVLGDLPKVTPVSKVVGDLALMMVGTGLDERDLLAADSTAPFPDSVVGLLRGDLGSPPGGFPDALRERVLRGRPVGVSDGVATSMAHDTEPDVKQQLYPDLWVEMHEARERWGDVSRLPTDAFYFGLDEGESIEVDLSEGRTSTIECRSIRLVPNGHRYEYRLDGQPRVVLVPTPDAQSNDRQGGEASESRPGLEGPGHVSAPFDGLVVERHPDVGSEVAVGEVVYVIEAMKMRSSITSPCSGRVVELLAAVDARVETGDLLFVIEPEPES